MLIPAKMFLIVPRADWMAKIWTVIKNVYGGRFISYFLYHQATARPASDTRAGPTT